MITVITGPPCAGKSAFAQHSAADGDVIVDFDLIATAFGSSSSHDAPPAIKQVAHAARAAGIARILTGVDADSWVIHGEPNAEWTERYKAAGVKVETINPGIDVCLRRAAEQNRPGWTIEAIDRWYAGTGEKRGNPYHDERGRFAGHEGAGGKIEVDKGISQVPAEHLKILSDYAPDTEPERVQELADDMQVNGMQSPVTVETDGERGWIQDGNHRLAAAQQVGIHHIPTRFVRAETKYLSEGGAPALPPTLQQHLSENPELIKDTVQRQETWYRGSRFGNRYNGGKGMLTKNTTATKVKAGPEDGLAEGEFIVYPSTFTKEPDAVGDVVAPGAFLKSLERWDKSGNVLAGLYGHRTDDPDFYVASAIATGEDEHGWWVKGAFDMDSPKGPQVYRLVKGRRLNQLSFAYDVIDQAEVEVEPGVKANELRELEVYEFSFVPVGANQDTGVVAVKAIVEGVQAELKAGRTLSAKNETALRGAYDSIGNVLDSLDAGAAPAAPADEPATNAGKASGTDPSSHTPAPPAGRWAGPNPSVATALLEADLALSA